MGIYYDVDHMIKNRQEAKKAQQAAKQQQLKELEVQRKRRQELIERRDNGKLL